MTTLDFILQKKVIAIIRGIEMDKLLKLSEALLKGGIQLMEITFSQSRKESWKDTADGIASLIGHFGSSVKIGAGTVLNEEQLKMAAEAGAEYIITPNTDAALIRKTKQYGLCCLPGAMTPSEVVSAWQAGADAVKIFPAGVLGTDYIKAVKAPLSHIPMLAVGGINEKNAADFLRSGCCGIGVGGNLVSKAKIESGNWSGITETAKIYREAVNAAEKC